MPAARFSHAARLDVPLDVAWHRLQHGSTWEAVPGVNRVFDVEHGPEGDLVAYRFTASAGGTRYQGTARVREARPPHRMVVDIDTREVVGQIEARLSAGNPSPTLTVTLVLESRGLLATVLFPVLERAVATGLKASVEDFASRLKRSS